MISTSTKKSPPLAPATASSEEGKGNGDNNMDEGDESNKGDGGKKSDGDDESVKDTSGQDDEQKAKRKLKFDPADVVIRVNGQLVKGSHDDLEKAKHVTDIHFPIVPQFLRLRGLKPQNVDEVEANALSPVNKIKKGSHQA